MNKKSKTPRRKRMTKHERLNSAVHWIKNYSGKSIITGYAKWFGVDKICAIIELKSIGVLISESLENQIIKSHQARIEQRRISKQKKEIIIKPLIESDDYFSYIVGYTSAGFPYGLTHDEFKIDEL